MVVSVTRYRRANEEECKAVFKAYPEIEERICEYVKLVSEKELYRLKYQAPEMLKGGAVSKMRGRELVILRKLPRSSDFVEGTYGVAGELLKKQSNRKWETLTSMTQYQFGNVHSKILQYPMAVRRVWVKTALTDLKVKVCALREHRAAMLRQKLRISEARALDRLDKTERTFRSFLQIAPTIRLAADKLAEELSSPDILLKELLEQTKYYRDAAGVPKKTLWLHGLYSTD